jgi:hypothetical protein
MVTKIHLDRDNNAVNNMLTIANQFLKDKTIPIYFTRGVKLEEIKQTIKNNNPKIYI